MDERINIGDKVDLDKIETKLSAGPDKKRVTYSSQVLDEGKDGNIFIAMPIHEGKLVPLNIDQEFFATFFTKSGLMRCKVVVVGRYKKNALSLLEVMQKTKLEKFQRREYFRHACRIPLEYRIVKDIEKEVILPGDAYNTDEWQLEWKNGIAIDLSGGGIRFVGAIAEEKGSILQVRFNLTDEENPEMIYSYAKLLRCEKSENNRALYDNRIEFWRMDQGTCEKIIHFIFEEQRKKRSKQLGN